MADDVKTGIRVVVEGTDDFATDLNSVAGALDNAKSSAQGAESAINNANSATEGLANNAPAHAKSFAIDMGDMSIAVIASVAAIVKVVSEVIEGVERLASLTGDYGDSVQKGAKKLDFSTDAYQRWDYVLQKNGSSMKKAEGAITQLTKRTAKGSDDTAMALDALGIGLEDAQAMSGEQLFEAVVSALQEIPDAGDRAAIASDLMGESYKNLGTLLSSSGEEVEELKTRAEDLGLIMSESGVEAAANYKDSLEDLQKVTEGISHTLGEELIPVIAPAKDALIDLLTSVDWSTLGAALASALGPAVQFLNDFILPLAGAALSGVVATLSLLLKILGGLGNAGYGLVSGMTGGTPVDTLLGEGLSVDELEQMATEAQAAYEAAQAAVQAGAEDDDADMIALINEMNAREQELQVATEAYERAKKALEGGGETGGKTPTETGGETAPEQTNQQIQGAANEAETAALQMMQTYDEAAGTITSTFIQGTDEASQAAVESIENLNDTMALNMAELNNNAYIWGMDMMRLLANGIADGSNTYILPAIDQLTELIKSRLGYSEPSVGPLARTHTWMPDMMALLARGIRDSSWMVASALGEAFDLAPVLSARGGSSFNYGGVSVQIYAAPGQSVDELYNVFSYRLARDVADREAVFST